MIPLKENFIVDNDGKKVGVLLDMDTYQKIIDALEELDEIHAYDSAKAMNDEIIPFDQAIKEIENER